jgi:hypothetical protein
VYTWTPTFRGLNCVHVLLYEDVSPAAPAPEAAAPPAAAAEAAAAPLRGPRHEAPSGRAGADKHVGCPTHLRETITSSDQMACLCTKYQDMLSRARTGEV